MCREFSGFDDLEKIQKHKFSLKHRLAMKKIFARYEKNVRKITEPQAAGIFSENNYIPCHGLKQRLIVALAIVFLMTLLTGWYIPLRSVTQAQIDWLRSKYDFPNMLMWVSEMDDAQVSPRGSGIVAVGAWRKTDEYSNFLDDLVELGLYSEEEIRTIDHQHLPVDTRSAPSRHKVELTPAILPEKSVTPLVSFREFILGVEQKIERYRDRAKDPERAWEGDEEFAQHIEEDYLPLPKSFLNLLEKLYAEIPEDAKEYKNFLSELDKDSRIYLAQIHKI